MKIIERSKIRTTSARQHFRLFMQSPLSRLRLEWDPEPEWGRAGAPAAWTEAVLRRFAEGTPESARGLAHSKTWRSFRRFMEGPRGCVAVQGDPVPRRLRSRPAGSLSSAACAGERRGEEAPSADGSMDSALKWSRRNSRARGVRCGWLFLLAPLLFVLTSCTRHESGATADHRVVDYYTCSMHPAVHSQDPYGRCPICNMTLIPVYKQEPAGKQTEAGSTALPTASGPNAASTGRGQFIVPVERQQQIGVTYAVVTRKELRRTLRAVGTVTYDTQRHWDVVSRVQGYVEQLRVSSPGEIVEKHQPLLTLYSPDLLTTQRELVDLLRMRDEAERSGSSAALVSARQLIASAEQRLSLWNITGPQIAELERTRQPRQDLTLDSPVRGVVHHVHVGQGQNVNPGDVLVDVADLSVVWVWAQVYQEEIPFVHPGMPAQITTSAYPNARFTGTIAVVDPFLNDAQRTGRLRLDIDNAAFKLRNDMYVNAELELDAGRQLAVPVSAVLPTGERDLVFVDQGAGRLEARFVKLGGKFGDDYQVTAGLKAGERVVDSANFLIDAESKIQGALKAW